MDSPVCSCHGEPMRWHKNLTRRNGGYWECRVKHDARVTEYTQTPAGRAVRRKANNRYNHSRKGRERRLRENRVRWLTRIEQINKELSHT